MAINTHIKRAVDCLGSQAALAKKIGKSTVFVCHLYHGKRPVPPTLCQLIEVATGNSVTRYELRPDVFGSEPPVIPMKSAS